MTFRNSEEIKVIEDWRFVWWDLDRGVEYFGAITGTHPKLEWRYIQNIYGKIVHLPDGGDLELLYRDETCDEFQVRLRCKTCGKTFYADI